MTWLIGSNRSRILSYLPLQGVDIIGGDINGLSTRIHDENEAKVQFMKQDQSTRYESY